MIRTVGIYWWKHLGDNGMPNKSQELISITYFTMNDGKWWFKTSQMLHLFMPVCYILEVKIFFSENQSCTHHDLSTIFPYHFFFQSEAHRNHGHIPANELLQPAGSWNFCSTSRSFFRLSSSFSCCRAEPNWSYDPVGSELQCGPPQWCLLLYKPQ